MNFSKYISGFILLSAMGSGVVHAEPVMWERGCGVRDIPHARYQDLRYATPPEYYPSRRAISWQANNWDAPQQNYRTGRPVSDNRYQQRYRNNPRDYGQQNYYDTYSDYEYNDHAYTEYPSRNTANSRFYYPDDQYVPQYYDSYPTISRVGSRFAVIDGADRDDGTTYFAPEFEAYRPISSGTYRNNDMLIKKQAIYPPRRVYTSPQSTIVGGPSSVPYGNRVSEMVSNRTKPKRGIVLPGPESVYPRQGTSEPAVGYVTSAGRVSSSGETENRASVSNAYFPRQGMSVVDTQKKSALPAQGQK